MFWIKRCVESADRLARGMTLAYGTWAPTVATFIGALWWLTGYAWPVLALGLVVVPLVRMTIDRRIERRWSAPETPQAHAGAAVEAGRD